MLKSELRCHADALLSSIREVLPDVATVREALTFARLVMAHPDPPRELSAMR